MKSAVKKRRKKVTAKPRRTRARAGAPSAEVSSTSVLGDNKSLIVKSLLSRSV